MFLTPPLPPVTSRVDYQLPAVKVKFSGSQVIYSLCPEPVEGPFMVRQAHHERHLAQPIFMIRWWAPAHGGLL